MVNRLQRLIEEHQVIGIQICRFSDAKVHDQSENWSFGHEFIQVGGQPYNLNRVITFNVVDQVLLLFF